LVNGRWSDSSSQLEIQAGGGALAAEGPTRFYVPGDLYNDAVQCWMSSGRAIVTRPIGLALFDGQKSVLVAELREGPVGQLLGSGSAAVYTNICTDVRGDLLVENRKAGYEASLILRERFDPADWGFTNLAAVRVQWLTEFLGGATPQVSSWQAARRLPGACAPLSRLMSGSKKS
jgi:hypothetical protein